MNLLIDTNVMLRLAQVSSPHHVTARSAVVRLAESGLALCIVPQVIYEFWVVATRPLDVNGLGMDVKLAEKSISGMLEEFLLLKDERGVFGHWKSLVIDLEITGKPAHDARLVAAMQRHGLANLLTFNAADFVKFREIHVYTPADVLSGQIPS